ncbi:YdbH domain-containing protein [Marinobacterium rhizophilum]|uniref:YdbH domain-containing protein n=1 Tax=Marinobacterium rhizophilum TaxID=420402 RepID=UPI00036E6E8B|nr:YdbH domain-containing protein [Marinobacterium rhizophilum]
MRPALWLLTPLLLLALLYAVLPRLAGYSIEHWLQAHGIEQTRIDLEHPGWNQLKIRSVTLSQQRDNQRIELDTGPVLIEYDPLDLIGRLRLNRVHVSNLKLHLLTQAQATPAIYGTEQDLRPLLPAAWLALAPTDQLQVDQLELSLSAQDQPRRDLRGTLNLQDNRLNSRMQLFESDTPLGWLEVELDHENHFELRLLKDTKPLYQAHGDLQPDSDRLAIQLQQSIDLTEALRWQHQLPTALLSGELPPIQGHIETRGLIRLPLRLDSAHWLQALALEQTLTGSVQLDLNQAQLQRVQFPLNASMQLLAGNLRLTLPAGSRAELQGLALPGFAPTQASAELASALTLSSQLIADPDSALGNPDEALGTVLDSRTLFNGLQLPAIQLRLLSPPLQHSSGTLSFSPARLDIDELNLQAYRATGRLRIPKLHWQAPGQVFPSADLDTRFALTEGVLSNRFTLAVAEPALSLTGRGSTRLSPFVSDIHWQASPLALQHAERLWNRYHPPAPPEFSINAGVLHHNGSANINASGIALRLEQHTDQLAARWGSVELQGLGWRSSTQLRHNGRLQHEGHVQLDQLDVGFPVRDIALDYGYQQAPAQAGLLHLQNLDAHLLGGSLALDSVTINPQSPTLSTKLTLQRLQLQKVLELQQQEGLSGEGLLSGVLPLTYDADGIRVQDGRIDSEGPGVIRFSPDARISALGQSNQGMAMALKALKNFQYEALSVKLQYDADGAALMNTRLQGRNPDWNNGRPVDFSINIEQNVLKLLQALQFTDKLTESIEKRYR